MKNAVKTFAKSGVALALCLCTFGAAQADGIKIGFINPDRIMKESTPAKAMEKKLDGEFSKRGKELQSLQSRLKTMSEKFDKDVAVLSETDRLKRQRELAEVSQDFQRKQRAYRDEFLQRRNEEFAKIYERVNKEINKIANEGKYDLIVQDAVYFAPRIDITDQVLKAINN